MRSTSPCCRKAVGKVRADWMPGFGSAHARHSRQVSQTSEITLLIEEGSPTCWKIVFMDSGVACHHRRCSLRTSLRITDGFCDLSSLMLWFTSNFDQSDGRSPVPVSANLLRSRVGLSSESASPLPGASGGEGAGASSSPIL